MEAIALKILIGIATNLFTEKFFSKLIGHGLLVAAKSTTNSLTKEWATDGANALGITKLDAEDPK